MHFTWLDLTRSLPPVALLLLAGCPPTPLDPIVTGTETTTEAPEETIGASETGDSEVGTTGPESTGDTTDEPGTTTEAPTGEACDFQFPDEPDDGFDGEDPVLLPLRIEADAPASLPEGSRLYLAVYGYDKNIADLPATLVRSHTLPIDALPFELDLTIPNPPNTVIPAEAEDARYYLAVQIDANADDCVTAGDYRLDYDKLDGTLQVALPPPGTVTVPVKQQ